MAVWKHQYLSVQQSDVVLLANFVYTGAFVRFKDSQVQILRVQVIFIDNANPCYDRSVVLGQELERLLLLGFPPFDIIKKFNSNTGAQTCQWNVTSEICSFTKRSTNNCILIAETGAIPVLKELIMFAGAVTSIVLFLKAGTMISRENSEVTLFTLLLANENKITVGESASLAWNQ
ncbi:hypothetical protein YC2023_060127 [Brassica napus]